MGSRGKLRWVVVFFVLAAVGSKSPARAELIAYWHFNDSNLVVDAGLGTLTTNFPAVDISYSAGSTRNSAEGAVAGQALTLRNQANNAVGRLDIAVDASAYQGLSVSLATQKTSTGFSSNQIAYSANGGVDFINFAAPYNPPTSFDLVSFDFAGITALNNNPNAVIRILFSAASSATGNNRLDNIQLLGTSAVTAAPEPSTGWLCGCAVAAMWWRRRRG